MKFFLAVLPMFLLLPGCSDQPRDHSDEITKQIKKYDSHVKSTLESERIMLIALKFDLSDDVVRDILTKYNESREHQREILVKDFMKIVGIDPPPAKDSSYNKVFTVSTVESLFSLQHAHNVSLSKLAAIIIEYRLLKNSDSIENQE